ncbi:MAG: hypothetical protein ACOYYJ_13425, partial [Chloroflexota bacterium]
PSRIKGETIFLAERTNCASFVDKTVFAILPPILSAWDYTSTWKLARTEAPNAATASPCRKG